MEYKRWVWFQFLIVRCSNMWVNECAWRIWRKVSHLSFESIGITSIVHVHCYEPIELWQFLFKSSHLLHSTKLEKKPQQQQKIQKKTRIRNKQLASDSSCNSTVYRTEICSISKKQQKSSYCYSSKWIDYSFLIFSCLSFHVKETFFFLAFCYLR